MQKFGEFIRVKIENMMLEHTEAKEKRGMATDEKGAENKPKIRNFTSPVTQNTVIIAVCKNGTQAGILKELGADMTIVARGGASPSAKCFFDKLRSAKGENIFIFPNDKNTILAAKQAAELSDIKGIRIIPSTSFPECCAALSVASSYDPSELEKHFIRAIEGVSCGMLCPAIRSCSIDGIDIKKGEFVGFIRSKAVLSDKDSLASALMLSDMLIGSKTSLFTIFRGKGADKRESARIRSIISKKHPDVEVTEIYSADEIYHYILASE
jgi:dihydroxyacetone kinase-like predicted kinase